MGHITAVYSTKNKTKTNKNQTPLKKSSQVPMDNNDQTEMYICIYLKYVRKMVISLRKAKISSEET